MADAVTTVSVEIAGKEISFETGKMAKQASGAVVVQAGDTMVLVTATAGNLRDVDFLPLTVDIEERMYAAGKIPGSFFKREGRAGEKGTLTARLIDRPIRPLFPKGWRYETQLVSIPLSVDHVNPYDILAMNGASAALMVSDIPFPTPVGAVRIGKIDGNFVVNPDEEDLLENTDLDLIVAGTEEAILMVEAGANEIPEAEILDALDIAHDAIKKLCTVQCELQKKAGKEKTRGRGPAGRREALQADQEVARQGARQGHPVEDKLERQDATQGRRGRGARAVRRQPDAEDTPSCAPRRSGPSTSSRRRSSASASRSRRSVPDGRGTERDPSDLDRRLRRSAHARLRAVHARPDAGVQRRRARHDARGDAPRHARSRDVQALLPPLQLPAVLGRGGRLHARPQAPRHRPRRARRACAGADDPDAGGVPLRRSASSRTSSSPTDRRRWPPSAARRCR